MLLCTPCLQVDLNKELMNGRMAIHFAADYGQIDVIDYLVSQKADVNVGIFR